MWKTRVRFELYPVTQSLKCCVRDYGGIVQIIFAASVNTLCIY